MKRPVAEFLSMTLKSGSEGQRAQYEHEAWQILRRKPGYVTHRVYQECSEPLHRLVYSEWDSRKAADGARQHLQGTPLMRRGLSLLVTAPERRMVELIGPITSTKGLALPEGAVAATVTVHLTDDQGAWRIRQEKLWKELSARSGHITHLLFRGFDDASLAGSLSHWADAEALEAAIAAATASEGETATVHCLRYKPVRD